MVKRTHQLDLVDYYPQVYEEISERYHSARFGTRPGKYDLIETQSVILEICDELDLPMVNLPVLDVGCGTGKASMPLAMRGACVTGLDASMGMLKQYNHITINEAPGSDLYYVNASASAIPFPEGTFDVVLSSRFLHLFPLSYYPSLLCEMLRVVKMHGYLIIEIKNKYYGFVINLLKDVYQSPRNHPTSSCMSIYEVYQLQKTLGDARIVSVKSCLLPKGHLVPSENTFSVMLRSLSRTIFRPITGFFFVVIQRGSDSDASPLCCDG